jgi:glycosyltransferase involved in cell wall biosynthesis
MISVLNQTLQDIEIICINDGSTDRSGEILAEFASCDERVVLINQENKGQGAARNRGIDIAQGEYIGFVDGDDWIDLNYFEELYNVAKRYDADMSCCNIVRKYPSSKTRTKFEIKEEKLYVSALEKFKITETPRKCYVYNKIYRKSKLLEHGIRFPEGVSFEDIAFSIRAIYFLEKLVTTSSVTYYYWVNYQSTTRQMTDIKRQDLLLARSDFIEFSRKYHVICDEKLYIKRKIVYKFFGIPLIKICEWETSKKYYLFATFPIFEKKIFL